MMQNAVIATGESKIDKIKISAADALRGGRYVENFGCQGFTIEDCVGELAGNCMDAKAKNMKFIVENTGPIRDTTQSSVAESSGYTIRVVDNGRGMSKEDLQNKYVPFHEECHTNDKSSGTRGVGGKKANCLLSKQKFTKVITSNDGINFITLEQNWEKCISINDLGELNSMRDSNISEIAQFKCDRSNMGKIKTGTTIVIPYSPEVLKKIKNLITQPKIVSPENRLDILMGDSGMTFEFNSCSNPNHNGILMPEDCYKYFDYSLQFVDFVTPKGWENGICQHPINVYEDKRTKEKIFIMRLCNNPNKRFRLKKDKRTRNGYSSKPTIDCHNYDKDIDFEKISRDGEIIIETAFRNAPDFFKPTDRKLNGGGNVQSDYDKNYFEKPNTSYQSQIAISRCGQNLAGVPRPTIVNSARGNFSSRALLLTRARVRVNTTGSSQDTLVDDLIKVDQNKQARRQADCFPIKFDALVDFARSEHRNRVIKTMKDIIRANIEADEAAEKARLEEEAKLVQQTNTVQDSDNSMSDNKSVTSSDDQGFTDDSDNETSNGDCKNVKLPYTQEMMTDEQYPDPSHSINIARTLVANDIAIKVHENEKNIETVIKAIQDDPVFAEKVCQLYDRIYRHHPKEHLLV